MEKTQNPKQDVKKAMLLSIIPGLGQFYNRQVIKGVIFLAIAALFVVEMALFGFGALADFITLGTVPGQDHSLFMMIRGTLQILVTVIFLIFYAFNIRDAKKVAEHWNAVYQIAKRLKN